MTKESTRAFINTNCGRMLQQDWSQVVRQSPKRDHSNAYQDENAAKSARKNRWERKKSKKGRK